MVSKGQFVGLDWNRITRLHSQVMTGTQARSNLIIMLMCVELVLLASTILLLFESRVLDTLFDQIFAIVILTVAAAESAIGLAITK